jgi:hypothetical protein
VPDQSTVSVPTTSAAAASFADPSALAAIVSTSTEACDSLGFGGAVGVGLCGPDSALLELAETAVAAGLSSRATGFSSLTGTASGEPVEPPSVGDPDGSDDG